MRATHPSARPVATPAGGQRKPDKGLRTYLVEDSPMIRDNLIETLEELLPLEVVGTADEAPAAVHWLREAGNACDLAIVDIFLKQGSGLQVLQALHGAGKPCKVVVLSNFATPEMRKRCLELGADEVFDKSNELDTLVRYCQRLAAPSPETRPGRGSGDAGRPGAGDAGRLDD